MASNQVDDPDIILCLSGGGLRATYFHLGVIQELRRQNLLGRVRSVFAVSGGSILAAHLALHWEDYVGSDEQFKNRVSQVKNIANFDLRGRIVRRWLLYCFVGGRFLSKQASRTKLLEREYERLLRGASLNDILIARSSSKAPEIYLATTSMTTGNLCAFSANGFTVWDQPSKHFQCSTLRLAKAVAASSAFPPLFPPVEITRSELVATAEDFTQERDFLTDGGVFDNLGLTLMSRQIQPETLSASKIFYSDAGAKFDWRPKQSFTLLPARTSRSVEIMMERISEYTKIEILNGPSANNLVRIAIDDDQQSWNPVERGWIPSEVKRRLAAVRTDLDQFGTELTEVLIRHGSEVARGAVTDLSKGTSHPTEVSESEHTSNWQSLSKFLDSESKSRWRLFSVRDWASYALGVALISALALVQIPFFFQWSYLSDRLNLVSLDEDALEYAAIEGPLTDEDGNPPADYVLQYRKYMSDLQLKWITPSEFLVSSKKGSRLLPHEKLWPQSRKLAVVLEELAIRLGEKPSLVSVYRSPLQPSFLKRIGRPPKHSNHILFRAADIKFAKADAATVYKILTAMRKEGLFSGGVGVYVGSGANFVHVDVGSTRNWGPASIVRNAIQSE